MAAPAVMTTKEKRRVQYMNPVFKDVSMDDRLDRLDTEGRPRRTITAKTATATLTAAEVYYGLVTGTHSSSAIALTLPAASTDLTGSDVLIAQGGAAAVTVVVTAGFGGGGAGGDTATLAQGLMCRCYCDGTNWYVMNVTDVA